MYFRKIFDAAKWGLALGREPQSFLGAKWVERILDRSPESKKFIWALRLLSLSPHYFISPDAPEYKGMSTDAYLRRVYQIYLDSRQQIYDQILKGRFSSDSVVLDYGCGPGFLARVVSPHVKRIYACDISTGALACAKVLNAAPNLEYIVADEAGLDAIEDESLDVVFSFAMVQHLSDEALERVLKNCRRMLKPAGRLIFHIQLLDGVWKTEEEWRNDTSVVGRIKFRYGLHCFGRTEELHRDLFSKHGFAKITFEDLANMVTENFDDVCSQSLLTAVRSD